MKKKILALIAAFIVPLTMLAGCGVSPAKDNPVCSGETAEIADRFVKYHDTSICKLVANDPEYVPDLDIVARNYETQVNNNSIGRIGFSSQPYTDELSRILISIDNLNESGYDQLTKQCEEIFSLLDYNANSISTVFSKLDIMANTETDVTSFLHSGFKFMYSSSKKDDGHVYALFSMEKILTEFSDGMYKVTDDIEPGEYLLTPISGQKASYKISSSSSGEESSISAEESFSGSRYVTVEIGDYLTIENCTATLVE